MKHFSLIEPGPEPGTNLVLNIKVVSEQCDFCNTPIVETAYITVDKGMYNTKNLVKLRDFLNQLNFGE